MSLLSYFSSSGNKIPFTPGCYISDSSNNSIGPPLFSSINSAASINNFYNNPYFYYLLPNYKLVLLNSKSDILATFDNSNGSIIYKYMYNSPSSINSYQLYYQNILIQSIYSDWIQQMMPVSPIASDGFYWSSLNSDSKGQTIVASIYDSSGLGTTYKQLYYSTNGGSSWNSTINFSLSINNNITLKYPIWFQVACTSDILYSIVWDKDDGFNIYLVSYDITQTIPTWNIVYTFSAIVPTGSFNYVSSSMNINNLNINENNFGSLIISGTTSGFSYGYNIDLNNITTPITSVVNVPGYNTLYLCCCNSVDGNYSFYINYNVFKFIYQITGYIKSSNTTFSINTSSDYLMTLTCNNNGSEVYIYNTSGDIYVYSINYESTPPIITQNINSSVLPICSNPIIKFNSLINSLNAGCGSTSTENNINSSIDGNTWNNVGTNTFNLFNNKNQNVLFSNNNINGILNYTDNSVYLYNSSN